MLACTRTTTLTGMRVSRDVGATKPCGAALHTVRDRRSSRYSLKWDLGWSDFVTEWR